MTRSAAGGLSVRLSEPAVRGYLHGVRRAASETLRGKLDAVILTGSAVLGDFHPKVSDIDLLLVVSGTLDQGERADLASELAHDRIGCPAVGLDLTVYRRSTLDRLPRPVPYEFGLETGPRWGTRSHGPGAEAELVLDLAVARTHGIAQAGSAPAALIAPIPRARVLDALATVLRWHASATYDPFHDPTGAQAVLNACRALHYLEQGTFVSKSLAARWAASRNWGIAIEAEAARRTPTARLPHGAVTALLPSAWERLDAAVPPPDQEAS